MIITQRHLLEVEMDHSECRVVGAEEVGVSVVHPKIRVDRWEEQIRGILKRLGKKSTPKPNRKDSLQYQLGLLISKVTRATTIA